MTALAPIANFGRHRSAYGAVVATSRLLPGLVVAGLAPRLEPGSYGTIALLATFYSVLLAVSDLGLDWANTYEMAHTGDPERNAVLGVQLKVRVVLAFFMALVAAAVVATESHGSWLILMVGAGGTLAAATSVLRLPLRLVAPHQEARLLAAERITVAVVASVGFASPAHAPTFYAVGVLTGPAFLVALRPEFRAHLSLTALTPRSSDLIPAARQVRRAAPFAAGAIAALLYWRLGLLAVSLVTGAAAAGVYASGLMPVMALSMVPGASAVLVLARKPDVASERPFHKTLPALLSGVAVAAVAEGILFVLPAGLGGSVTPESIAVAQVLVLALPFMFVNPFLGMELRASGRAWSVAAVSIAGLVVNFAITVAVVRHGLVTVAVGSVVTEGVVTAAAAWLVLRKAAR